MDSWTLRQLRALVLTDLNNFIPEGYFEQNMESSCLNNRAKSNEYLSFEHQWGYLAGKLGYKLYFNPPTNLSPRQVAASEVLMNLGMLASAEVSLSACEQIQTKALEKDIPDGNAGNVAVQLRTDSIPKLQENIRGALEQYLLHLTHQETRPYVSLLVISENQNSVQTTPHQQTTDDIFDIKPNFYGIGINLNALWRRVMKGKNGR